MPRKLATLLLLCFAFSGAEAQSSKPAAKSSTGKLMQKAPAEDADLIPRTVFDVLLGEIALQRGAVDMALSAWVDLARRTADPRALSRAVEIATHAQQYDLALELARQWVKVRPDSLPAQQALTSTLILMNRTEDMGEQIAALLERDKESLTANLMRLPRVLARQTDKQAVQRVIDRVAKPYIGIAEAHVAMAIAAFAANDFPRARSESELALQLRPDWEYAALLVAQALAKDSNEEAIAHLQRFVASYPQAADVRITLARLLIGEKRYAEARAQFNRLLEERPNDPDALYPAAMLALQFNDKNQGRQLLERMLASNFADKSSIHYFLGQIDEDDRKPEAALEHYQQVIAGEQFLASRARIAQILRGQGKLDEAIMSLRATPGKTPKERTDLTITEAALLRDAKRHDEAFKLIETALRAQPDNTELLYEAALAAERVGKFELMEAHLQKLIKLKPDNAAALNALGYSLADRNIRLDEALRLINKASELSPKDAFIMDSLGWIKFRRGDLAEALTTLQAAYRLRSDPEIAAHLGEVLWQLNRRDDAQRVWRESAADFPENDTLQAVIRRFQQ